jgi:lysophospholipase L1-like esterase
VAFYDPVGNYPAVLRDLLRTRYKAQDVTVVNAGRGGDKFTSGDPTGELRLEGVIALEHPDVLIVLQGVNDLNNGTSPQVVSEALRRAVRRARNEGVPLVIISTILPGVAGRTKPPDPVRVNELNAGIRSWAASAGALLVDSYAVFEPEKDTLIGQDGLHPTPAGNRKLAEGFFAAIRANFELPPPTAGAAMATGERP